jgi:hypothetical protein
MLAGIMTWFASRVRLPVPPPSWPAVGDVAGTQPGELPPLARILERYRRQGTVAATLTDAPASVHGRFDEVLDGLHVRELRSEDLFVHFFGHLNAGR